MIADDEPMADEGTAAPPGGDSKDVVDWAEITLTAQCNQRCFFCYEVARNNAAKPGLDEVRDLLRQTKQHAEQVVLCGKEFLLRSDALEIVSLASGLGLRTVVFTNGQALARKGLVASLAEAGCDSLAISFHFPDREVFGRAARVASRLFDRVIKGMEALGDYHRVGAGRPISVSTETDMFALNVGRLKEMREILQTALGPTSWRMRLASLLPTRIYDIGLAHVLDPLDQRREEVAEFVRDHPPEVPLAFVKVPLCIIPEGMEHLSLDAQYVYEGTVLTFNHAESGRITVDTISSSTGRDLQKLMDRHPYRWACRPCAMAPLCRFERVDWQVEGFLPSKEQRPLPYRPSEDDGAAVDRLRWPFRTTSASDALSPLGPMDEAIGRIATMRSPIAEPYPEETIIEALSDAPPGAPVLIDAWVDAFPILVLVLRVGEEIIELRLEAGREHSPIGVIVGGFFAAPLNRSIDCPAFLSCCRLLTTIGFREPECWETIPTFDPGIAELLDRAWAVLEERSWPRTGVFGDFKTEAAVLDSSKNLVLDLVGPRGEAARLSFRLESGGSRLEVTLGSDAAETEAALLATLRDLGPDLVPPKMPATDPGLTWTGDGYVRVEASSPGRADLRYVFGIAEHSADRSYFEKVDDLVLWYSHETMDRSSTVLCDLLLRVMKSMGISPNERESLPHWREAILCESRSMGLDGRVQWSIEWQPARV